MIPYWQIWIYNTKAAKLRLFDACVALGVPMKSYLRHGDVDDRSGSISVLVVIPCADRKRFDDIAQLKSYAQWEWQPPCYFDNGTLIPYYASPEEQEANRHSQGYLDWCKKQGTEP